MHRKPTVDTLYAKSIKSNTDETGKRLIINVRNLNNK